MAQPATGAQVLAGFRRELAGQPGVPDPSKSRVWLEPILPLTADLVRTLGQADEVNAQGFGVRGIPGAITGPVDLANPLRASTSLEMFENLLGGVGSLTKSTLETGVYQYDGEPVRGNGDTTHDLLIALPPVDRVRLSRMLWGALTVAIAGNAEIDARVAGFCSHSTHLSAPVQASGTGDYAKGPDFRGPLRRPRVGEKVYIKATRAVSGGGLQLKLERVPAGGTPTYPDAAVDVAYDSDSNGTWQNAFGAYQLTGTLTISAAGTALSGTDTKFLDELEVGHSVTFAGETITVTAIASNVAATVTAHTAGASAVVGHRLLQDFGFFDENRDTLDFIFPGTSADHEAVDLNDVWSSEWDWSSDPTPTYIAGQRFTSAHWSAYWRRQGAATWIKVDPISGTLVLPNPVTVAAIWGSRHYGYMDRDGRLVPTLQFTRRFVDRELQQLAESHTPFEMRLIAEGRRLPPSGAYRESIEIIGPAAEITTRAAPVANEGAVVETFNIVFKAGEDGDPPWTTKHITDRNYTVAA